MALHKGVFGAAIATAISQVVVILFYLKHFFGKKGTIKFCKGQGSSSQISAAAVRIRDSATSAAIFWENTSFAFSTFFSPKRRATIVDVPTANVRDSANMPVTKGDDTFTAASAVSDTPLATNMASTIVYSANTHCAATAGRINRKKSRSALVALSLILTAAALIWLEELCRFLGATESLLPYAPNTPLCSAITNT